MELWITRERIYTASSPSSVSQESELGRSGESELAERETGERPFPASSPASPRLSLASLDFLARVTILRDCSQSRTYYTVESVTQNAKDIRKVVSYENWTTRGLFRKQVRKQFLSGREFIRCNCWVYEMCSSILSLKVRIQSAYSERISNRASGGRLQEV